MDLQNLLDKVVLKYKKKAAKKAIHKDNPLIGIYERMTLRRDMLDDLDDELKEVSANFKKRNSITDEEIEKAIYNALYNFFNT